MKLPGPLWTLENPEEPAAVTENPDKAEAVRWDKRLGRLNAILLL